MKIGLVGLGSIVETAYLPALHALGAEVRLWGFDPARSLPGVTSLPTLEALLAQPLDRLVIATPSLLHLPVLEQALESAIPLIFVEKPVVATLAQQARLQQLLADPQIAARVLALDHWMARNAVQHLLRGELDDSWQPCTQPNPPSNSQPNTPLFGRIDPVTLAEVASVEGFLLEPCGMDDEGRPYALNFATGEPDRRVLCHPDGVILDIGTHLLAMIRELLVALGGDDRLTLVAEGVVDRLGQPIARGDLGSAEGRACLRGEASGVPLVLWLDKYAGPGIERKGLVLHLKDGRRIELFRSGNLEWLDYYGETCGSDKRDQHLHGPEHLSVEAQRRLHEGPLYRDCIAQTLLAPLPAEGWRGVTTRRLQEVTLLLTLQQQLRGPH
ncbi:Gfo/Idh/MocA family oxidoreductase [Aeromonas allosaccharophila]|uniref:Gfo/Idh/MocA family oxidoreductase n=1 Tax=Aeromonas allosaccharophila TaxID=656 RepID=UPI001F279F2B|nr:Gfo/Idh/MocA family oxidoreductase [Aeromonas allosaccharophila]MCE9848967.1 Gfo/Idh/MocA family oxidoreductase [Aeromonas allosaccharophila]